MPARGAARRASAPPGWLKAADGCGKPGFESAREPAQHGVGLHIEGRRRIGGIRARSGAFVREAQQRQKQPIRAVGGFVFPEEAGIKIERAHGHVPPAFRGKGQGVTIGDAVVAVRTKITARRFGQGVRIASDQPASVPHARWNPGDVAIGFQRREAGKHRKRHMWVRPCFAETPAWQDGVAVFRHGGDYNLGAILKTHYPAADENPPLGKRRFVHIQVAHAPEARLRRLEQRRPFRGMKGISLLEVLRFEELSRIPVYRTLRLHVGLPNMVCAVPSDARSGSAPSYAREPASIKTDGKTSLSLSLSLSVTYCQ